MEKEMTHNIRKFQGIRETYTFKQPLCLTSQAAGILCAESWEKPSVTARENTGFPMGRTI